eukprot:2173590-Amphidinium_carterae.1
MQGSDAQSHYYHKCTDCGVPCAGMMFEPGGPGVPAAARCTGRGEVPVGRGALDETFDLAFDTELMSAAGKPQAGIFLD